MGLTQRYHAILTYILERLQFFFHMLDMRFERVIIFLIKKTNYQRIVSFEKAIKFF